MALAGAIIRTRKERERKRNESAEANREESLAEVVYNSASKDGFDSSVDLSRKSPTSLKKSNSKTEFVQKTTKLLSQSFDGSEPDGNFESQQSYSVVYIGLVLVCMGSVITFVGLGDKGFKTLELKLIGPILCLVGLTCVVYKIMQCTCPRLFQWPKIRRSKLTASESIKVVAGSSMVPQNGHTSNTNTKQQKGVEPFTPRVTLTGQSGQSSQTTQRAQSTVPNFIEDTSDEDEFESEMSRSMAQAHRAHQMELNQRLERLQQERLAAAAALAQAQATDTAEILLDPKSLKV